MTDNQGNMSAELVPFFVAWNNAQYGAQPSTQGLAVRAFLAYACNGNGVDGVDGADVLAMDATVCAPQLSLSWEGWASHMLLNGYTVKTTLMYLKLLYALIANKTEALRQAYATVRRRVQGIGNAALEARPRRSVIGALQRLATAEQLSAADRLGTDMLLFAVLSGGLSAQQLAEYPNRVPDAAAGVALRNIALRHSRPRPARLFPLGASRTTAARRLGLARAHLERALKSVGLPVVATPADIFCHAVLEVTGSMAIAAAWARRLDAGAASFCLLRDSAPELTDSAVAVHKRAVAAQVDAAQNVAHWYALRLRPGAKFQGLETALARRSDIARDVCLYQPLREIERRVGRRLVTVTSAALPGIFFMRCHPHRLGALLRHVVGPAAWCYRTTRSANAPYAVIPDAELNALRLAVDAMNPDTLSNNMADTLRPGDRVQVLSGAMMGRCARVELIERRGAATLCRLTFPGTAPISWTLTSPSLRLLNPAETSLQGS